MAQGKLGFYEKNLEEVLRRNMRAGRLMYSTEVAAATAKSSVIFLAEDTHVQVEDLALRLAQMARPRTIIVVSSPVR